MNGITGEPGIPLDRWLQWSVIAVFLGGVAAVVGLLAAGSEAVIMVPLVLIAVPAVVLAMRHPVAGLVIIFTLFVFASGTTQGVGVREILFGAFYIPYLVAWYFSRLFVYREPIIIQRGDAALLIFGAIVIASTLVGATSGWRPSIAVSELANFSLLAFYFPFRELCIQNKNAAWWLMLAVLGMGVVLVARNLMSFGSLVARATQDWQIAGGRVAASEVMLMGSATAGGVGLLYVRHYASKLILFAGFMLAVSGLVLTQFRAYYLGLFIALAIAFILTDRRRKVQLATFALLGLAGFAAIAYLILGDGLQLLFLGLTSRTLSIGTAASTDASLINRFFEYEEVAKLLLARPLVGYGLGSEFGFYDSIFQMTWVKHFIHNGFLHLWYKFGVFGMIAFSHVWLLSAWRGYTVFRSGQTSREKAPALFVLSALVGLAVSALVSVLFNSDSTMLFAICFAISAGLAWHAPPSSPSSATAA